VLKKALATLQYFAAAKNALSSQCNKPGGVYAPDKSTGCHHLNVLYFIQQLI